ncbi:hypothetical protein F2Q69_00048185 [Brassica cretica]|uniref:Uncharacterized protein n=1 Tax=Brassica cretica TaxID=69181 RepID=A0A8S9PP19_BRACR|nr:hypothetical protein F2Q69_00048185 [Brassica cretica]
MRIHETRVHRKNYEPTENIPRTLPTQSVPRRSEKNQLGEVGEEGSVTNRCYNFNAVRCRMMAQVEKVHNWNGSKKEMTKAGGGDAVERKM